MPGARRTRSLVCKGRKHTSSHHGRTGTPGIPARNGFNGFLRALPGDRALLSPSSALLLANLTPASRRQDHTTSPSASARFVKRAARVHRIPCPTSVTIAKRPSVWDGMARLLNLIWGKLEAEYFLKQDWTTQITLNVLVFLPSIRTPEIFGESAVGQGLRQMQPADLLRAVEVGQRADNAQQSV